MPCKHCSLYILRLLVCAVYDETSQYIYIYIYTSWQEESLVSNHLTLYSVSSIMAWEHWPRYFRGHFRPYFHYFGLIFLIKALVSLESNGA